MSGCVGVCPLEAQQQDQRSSGTIGDQEIICRAAYNPIAFKKGKLTGAIVRTGDLFSGTLSVWRYSENANTSLPCIIDICQSNTPAKNSLAEIRGVTAAAIRNVTSPEVEGRLFCVVDETDTDDNGGSHPAHAHIKICAKQMENVTSSDDLIFRAVKERLVFLFRQDKAKLYVA